MPWIVIGHSHAHLPTFTAHTRHVISLRSSRSPGSVTGEYTNILLVSPKVDSSFKRPQPILSLCSSHPATMEYAVSNGVSSAREKGVFLWELDHPSGVNGDNRPSQSAEMPPLWYDEVLDDQVSAGDSDSRPSCILIVPESLSLFDEPVYSARHYWSSGSNGTVLSDSLIDSSLIDATAEIHF